jgi:hypothetical protein
MTRARPTPARNGALISGARSRRCPVAVKVLAHLPGAGADEAGVRTAQKETKPSWCRARLAARCAPRLARRSDDFVFLGQGVQAGVATVVGDEVDCGH